MRDFFDMRQSLEKINCKANFFKLCIFKLHDLFLTAQRQNVADKEKN